MKSPLTVIIIAVALFTSALYSQPKLKTVPGETFSFGKVMKGTRPTKLMTIKNVGTDTLNVTDVSAQCGCTATMMSKQKIAPSDSGRLSIAFNTSSYDGPVTKHVYVSSNDPSTPRITIEFTADVIQAITADPNYLTFNVAKTDTTFSRMITLTNMTQQSIKILSIEPKFAGVKVSLMKNQLMPGEQTELQTVFRPSKLASFQGTIELKTDYTDQPELSIRLFEWYRQP